VTNDNVALLQSPRPSSELLEDILKEKPQEADGIDSVVVVDNVPQVGQERLEKLKNVIHKIFSKFGKITTEFYPETDGLTEGYVVGSMRRYGCALALMRKIRCKTNLCRFIFLEYGGPSQALEAVKNADGYKLDKQHTFRVNLFTDFDKWVCGVGEEMHQMMRQIYARQVDSFFSLISQVHEHQWWVGNAREAAF